MQASPAAKSMQEFRLKLPSFKMKDQLLQAVANNQVQLHRDLGRVMSYLAAVLFLSTVTVFIFLGL